jgi:hypothetical protein
MKYLVLFSDLFLEHFGSFVLIFFLFSRLTLHYHQELLLYKMEVTQCTQKATLTNKLSLTFVKNYYFSDSHFFLKLIMQEFTVQ